MILRFFFGLISKIYFVNFHEDGTELKIHIEVELPVTNILLSEMKRFKIYFLSSQSMNLKGQDFPPFLG